MHYKKSFRRSGNKHNDFEFHRTTSFKNQRCACCNDLIEGPPFVRFDAFGWYYRFTKQNAKDPKGLVFNEIRALQEQAAKGEIHLEIMGLEEAKYMLASFEKDKEEFKKANPGFDF